MSNEELKNSIARIKELETYIESLQTEQNNLIEDVTKFMNENNVDEMEVENYDIKIRRAVSYKYSQAVEDMENQIVPIKQAIKELKDVERNDGTAQKIIGKEKLIIKEKNVS